MRGRILILVFLMAYFTAECQDLIRYRPMKVEPVGGSDQVEQILQTQLTLPKNLLSLNGHKPVIVYFLIDSIGNASHLSLEADHTTPVLRNELFRMLRFMKFQRLDPDVQVPYQLNFTLSSDRYNHYLKQKVKPHFKAKTVADSSYNIYTRADRSPEYYKNGDEGLNEFFLEELEYPQTAITKSIEGTVQIEFIVETNGLVTGVRPLQSVHGGCTEEAMRLIKKTKWQPAVLNGKLVRYKTTYPVTFSLRNSNRELGYSTQSLGGQ